MSRSLALAAASAIGADLVGVDLVPTENGFVVSELNGAVDFRTQYALDGGDVFAQTIDELLRTARERRALSATA